MRTLCLLIALLLVLTVGCGRKTETQSEEEIIEEVEQSSELELEAKRQEMELCSAIAYGRIDEVKAILEKDPDRIKRIQDMEFPPIIMAVKNGDKDMLELLISKGESIKVHGAHAIIQAAEEGDAEMVQFLISRGAMLGKVEDYESPFLWDTIYRKHRLMIDLLLSAGLDIHSGGNELIDIALIWEDIDTARYLISKGAETNIYTAAAMNDVQRLKSLAAKKNALDEKGRGETTPLCMAVRCNAKEAIDYLLATGIGGSVNESDVNSHTPLYFAIKNKQYGLARKLISKGAEADFLSICGLGDLNQVKKQVEAGAEIVSEYGDPDSSPLCRAAEAGRLEVVKYLISKGAGKDDFELNNALLGAAEVGHIKTAEYLISKGASVNGPAIDEYTPLHVAVQEEMIVFLLNKGAKINALGGHGCFGQYTPLHSAASSGQLGKANLLISKGASINVEDTHSNETPLHCAVSSDDLKMVKLLIEKGAKVNAKDSRGRTPLRIAKMRGYTKVADYLRRRGGLDPKPLPDKEHWGFNRIPEEPELDEYWLYESQ